MVYLLDHLFYFCKNDCNFYLYKGREYKTKLNAFLLYVLWKDKNLWSPQASDNTPLFHSQHWGTPYFTHPGLIANPEMDSG